MAQFKGEAGGSPGGDKEEMSGVVGGVLAEEKKGWLGCRLALRALCPLAPLQQHFCADRARRLRQVSAVPGVQSGGPAQPAPRLSPAALGLRLSPHGFRLWLIRRRSCARHPGGRAGGRRHREEGPSRGPLVSRLLCGSCFSQASAANGLLSPGRTADPPVTGELWGLGSGARGAARAPTPSPTPQPHEHQAPARGPQLRAFPKPALLLDSWRAGAGGWRK